MNEYAHKMYRCEWVTTLTRRDLSLEDHPQKVIYEQSWPTRELAAQDQDRAINEFQGTWEGAEVIFKEVEVTPVVTHEMIVAALLSQAQDDEGGMSPLFELLDFSGENKRRMVVRTAIAAALETLVNPTPVPEADQPDTQAFSL